MLLSMLLLFALVIGFLLCLIPNLVWCLWWAVAAIAKCPAPRYAPFAWVALGVVLLAWLLMAYAFFIGRFRVEVKPTVYVNETLPASFDGYKIVHISDLHLSTFDDRPAALQRIVDAINAQQPDLICFTGDLVTLGISEAKPYADILRSLHAKDGVVSVLGNHDLMIYSRLSEAQRIAEVEQLVRYERETLGWTVLRNAHITLSRADEHIHILGVDNCSVADEGFRTIYSGDLQKAKAGANGFSVLLSHDPGHWRAEVWDTGIALTLSGHTHGGQMRIGDYPLSRLLFEEAAGWYSHGTQSLYVNTGIGCTVPLRLHCPSEITVITLRR